MKITVDFEDPSTTLQKSSTRTERTPSHGQRKATVMTSRTVTVLGHRVEPQQVLWELAQQVVTS